MWGPLVSVFRSSTVGLCLCSGVPLQDWFHMWGSSGPTSVCIQEFHCRTVSVFRGSTDCSTCLNSGVLLQDWFCIQGFQTISTDWFHCRISSTCVCMITGSKDMHFSTHRHVFLHTQAQRTSVSSHTALGKMHTGYTILHTQAPRKHTQALRICGSSHTSSKDKRFFTHKLKRL
jgi:hypothetical protein